MKKRNIGANVHILTHLYRKKVISGSHEPTLFCSSFRIHTHQKKEGFAIFLNF